MASLAAVGMMLAPSSFYLVLNVFVSPQVYFHLCLLQATQQQGQAFLPSENIFALRALFVLQWFTSVAEGDLM